MAAVRSSKWEDACTAAAVLAVDPIGVAGISLRSPAGPVRDRWLTHCMRLFPGRCKWHRVPANVGDDRLLGGLDLSATLRAGRPMVEHGILAQADGGVVMLAMAERLSAAVAAKIGCVLDRHEVALERDGFARRARSRFAVVALDEGIEADERPPDSLLERLALHINLNGVRAPPTAEAESVDCNILRARNQLLHVRMADESIAALCEVSAVFGVTSARAVWFAMRTAKAICALDDRRAVSEDDLTLAARLVFAPRATKAPCEPPPEQTTNTDLRTKATTEPDANSGATDTGARATSEAESEPYAGGSDSAEVGASAEKHATHGVETNDAPAASMAERVLAAAKASLPPDFLAQIQTPQSRAGGSRQAGRSGAEHISQSRGRPTGTRAGELRPGARVNVIETLRAAAPWQRFRRRAPDTPAPLIRVHKDDIRITRFLRRNRATTIFLVDASGSAALNRLAEVKGAVELMLAESYIRRDRVALISFRGAAAQVLLPPTNSLVRAKRELARLPGGGGTPLAIGIDTARVLADSLKRRGESPMVVVLTDGRPNITRDGKGNRVRAEADAVIAARMMRTSSITSLLVDTAPQPRVTTAQFAREMGAAYVPLPYVNASALANVVGHAAQDRHVHV